MEPVSKCASNYFVEATVQLYTRLEADFPKELILMIFKQLDSYHLVQAGRTCKRLHALSMHPELDLARFEIFSKKVMTKLPCPLTNVFGFLKEDHYVFQKRNSNHGCKLVKIDLISQKEDDLYGDLGYLKKMEETKDFFYFVYEQNDYGNDGKIYLVVTSKLNCLAEEIIYDFTSFIEIPLFSLSRVTVVKDQNIIAILMKNYVVCFKGTEHLLTVKPLENRESETTFTINNNYLLINYTSSEYTEQQLYHLQSKKLLSKRVVPGFSCFTTMIHSKVINEKIINYNYNFEKIILEIATLNFETKVMIKINLPNFDWDKFIITGPLKFSIIPGEFSKIDFHLYENIMCVFCIRGNTQKIAFFDLEKVKIFRQYQFMIDRWRSERQIFVGYRDKVAVVTLRQTIEIFDMNTGNLRKKFYTSHIPKWIAFGIKKEGYFLNIVEQAQNPSKTYYTHADLLASGLLKKK